MFAAIGIVVLLAMVFGGFILAATVGWARIQACVATDASVTSVNEGAAPTFTVTRAGERIAPMTWA